MECIHCHTTLEKTDKFCINCGHKISKPEVISPTKMLSEQLMTNVNNKTILIIGAIVLGIIILIVIMAAIIKLIPFIIIGLIIYFLIKRK